jgi:CRP-like cAMP-binding protein/predicted MFS family arabinose efflux permease
MADVERTKPSSGSDAASHALAILCRKRQFLPVLAAEGLSALGDAVFWVGLLVWLLGHANGTALIALAAVARLGPRAVFGAAGGVLADRFERRALLVSLDLVRAGLMGVLVWLVGVGGSPELVIGLVFVTYVLATPYRPAFTAGIPFVVGERDAAPANALLRSVRQIATFLGPLLGSAVLWLFAPRWAFAVNATTFALSALLLTRVPRLRGGSRAPHQRTGLGASWRRDLHEGVDAVLHQTGLAVMMWLIFVFSVARGFELVLLVLVARDHLGMGAEGVGVLNAAIGVGAIAAIPLIGRTIAAARPMFGVVVSLALSSVPLALLGVMRSAGSACAVLVAAGVGIVMFEVLAVSLVQRLSRLEILGRVYGIETMMVNGGKLAGSLLGPLLVAVFSLRVSLLVATVVVVASAALAMPALSRASRVAERRRHELEPIVDRLAHIELFDGASRLALERLAATMQVVTVARGGVVIAEGDAPDHLYVLRSGHLTVTKHGEQVATLVPDDWFGEIGLLQRVPRTATVRSVSDAELWQISGAEFLAAVNESALPPAALLEGISNRLAQLDGIEPPSIVLPVSEVELAHAASDFTRRGVRRDGPANAA